MQFILTHAELIMGVLSGAFLSWLITWHYYRKNLRDSKTTISKLENVISDSLSISLPQELTMWTYKPSADIWRGKRTRRDEQWISDVSNWASRIASQRFGLNVRRIKFSGPNTFFVDVDQHRNIVECQELLKKFRDFNFIVRDPPGRGERWRDEDLR